MATTVYFASNRVLTGSAEDVASYGPNIQPPSSSQAMTYGTMTFFANLEPILRTARANHQRCFLLAHSMGNLALESAVENWFLHGNGDAALFDLAVLAAGDCRCDSFVQPVPAGLSGLTHLAQRVSIYYSHVDHVLQLSAAVNLGAQRLGQDGPSNRSDPVAFPPALYQMADATRFQDFDFLTSYQTPDVLTPT